MAFRLLTWIGMRLTVEASKKLQREPGRSSAGSRTISVSTSAVAIDSR